MKKALQIILHLAGFPLLIALVVVFSLNMIELGISYGIMVFVGLIITVVMAIIYYLVFFLMAKSGKKTIYKQTIVSIIVAAICLGGLWIFVDVALPDLLAEATSKTIFYEDLADDYDARAEVNKELLDEYIRRNVANGNLKSLTKDEYLAQGARNKEVMALLKAHFQSIDKDGYATFVGPWLDMANGERLTIPVLVHLVINERDFKELPFPTRVGDEMKDDPVRWSILDMLGEPMVFELGSDGMAVIPDNLKNTLELFEITINEVLEAVSDAIENEDVVGSPIYIELHGTTLSLIPSNESRGVLDYQRMGWLNSNGLIFMITSLFSIRKLFLIFAGVLVVTTYAIGLLREKDAKNPINCAPNPRRGKKSGKASQNSEIGDNNLTTDYYKPYDQSYVVVRRYDKANYDRMTKQLLYDSQNNIAKRYDSSEFTN